MLSRIGDLEGILSRGESFTVEFKENATRFNFDDIEKEIITLWDSGQYKDIVKQLKYTRYEWPDEYFRWLLSVKNRLKIPIDKFAGIVQDDDLNPEEKLSWIYDWSAISQEIAFDYLETYLLPALIDKKSISIFLEKYCELLSSLLKDRSAQSRQKLLDVERLINEQIFEDAVLGQLQQKILIIMDTLGFTSDVIRILCEYNDKLPDKEEFYILLGNRTDDLGFLRKEIETLKQALTKIVESREADALLPRLSRYFKRADIYLKEQFTSLELVLNGASDITPDNLPDPNAIDYIEDFIEEFASGKTEFSDPIKAKNYLERFLIGDFIKDMSLCEEGRELFVEFTKRTKLHRRWNEEYLGNRVKELEDIYYKRFIDDILNKSAYSSDITWDDAKNLVKDFLCKNSYEKLLRYDKVIWQLASAEVLWKENRTKPSNSWQDLTYLVCGYFKTVEILLYSAILEIGKNNYGLKIYVYSKPIDIGSEAYEDTTIGNYNHFIRKNAFKSLVNLQNRDKVFDAVENWTQKFRNKYLHKGALRDVSTAEAIISSTQVLLEMLAENLKI